MAKAKVLKKQWYTIIAPKMFRNVVLGETIVYEPERMIGKGISQNLMNLTSDVKRQNIKINFEIVRVEDGKAIADIVGYNMVSSSVKRLVRRNINKIDLSFECTTSDKKRVRVKPIIITRSQASGSVATRIRANARDLLTKQISSMTYDNFINDLVGHKLQSTLKANLNKIHSLRVCEMRAMYLVKEHVPEAAKAEAQKRVKAKPESKAEEPKAEKESKAEEPKAEKEAVTKVTEEKKAEAA